MIRPLGLRAKTTMNLSRSPRIDDAELLLWLPLASPPLAKISRTLLSAVFLLLFLGLSSQFKRLVEHVPRWLQR